ncbi:MAG: hypothetical protein HW402_1127 [Dehalococcoidales bacterium]|nr:hypothetical protein [Dehalococcoidales bacterium]
MMGNIAEYIASYATSIKYKDIPPEVVHKTQGLLIDTLGCAIGGYSSEPAKIARRIAGKVSQCDMPATIIGSGQKSTPELATFANGIMMRYLDFNDGFGAKTGGHPSDNFAPVLTCADAVHASGREVIVAAVLAYEVFCRLGDQVELAPRGFDYAVNGVISCAVAAGKLLGLSQAQMVQAINLAITPNISLWQTRVGEVSMWKGAAMPNAARNAVFAAMMAKEGMTGPSPIFEGRYGLFKAVTGPFQLAEFGGNGRPFRIMDATIKKYPCGQVAQTAIDAALQLRSKISGVDEIAEINIETFASGKAVMADDAEKWHPETRESADHSSPYVVAVALMYGSVEQSHFEDEYRRNHTLLDLMQKIKVNDVDELTRMYPQASPNRVEIVTKSGKKLSVMVPYHHGHYLNPLNDREIEEKFNSLTRTLLTPAQSKELVSLIWNLEKLDDASKIMQLLRI